MIAWMMLGLVGCVSEHEFLETHSEIDFIYATVIMTPKSNPSGWFVDMDITVEAPSDVEVTIPTHSSTLGSFDVKALGFGGGGAPGARPGGGGPLDDTPPGVPGGGAFLYMPPRGVRSFLGLSGPSFLVLCDHKARSKRKQQKQKWTHCGQVLKILQIVVWAVLRGFFAFLPPTIKAAYNSLSAARVNKAQKKGNQARATQRKEGGREGRKEGRKEGQIKVK